MANEEQLAILKNGSETWNGWRLQYPQIMPDLSKADLTGADLSRANLAKANLSNVNLSWAKLKDANLRWADLKDAELTGADLSGTDLSGTDLSWTALSGADLTYADLREANLIRANLSQVNLRGADLRGASIGRTLLGDVDLSEVRGLEEVRHYQPSHLSTDTIYKSKGKIPEVFLRGCGVPDNMITFVHSLVGTAFEFYSCFISYSSTDDDFARRVHADLQDKGVRVWFAPEDVQGGRKLYEQIDRAIQTQDRLLVVLSENSLQSEWVMTEIRRARKVEIAEKRRKLFPIRLVDFEAIKRWECFDADSGKDLAVEMREYFIPDFSNWKNPDSYQKAFDRLLRDLKASEGK